MNTRFKSLFAVALATVVGSVWADNTTSRVISINFGSGSGTAEEGSGLIPVSADAWNNLSANENTRSDLVTWSGSMAETLASNWSVTWSCANLYQYTTDISDPILKGYLDDSGDGVSITVSSIPFAKYDLYIYQASDTENLGYNPPSVNGTYYSHNGNVTSTTRNDSALKYGVTRNATAKIGTNTICLQKGFTASTLEIKGAGNAGSARGGIAAIQIVEVTDPTQDSISVNIAGGNSGIASESITDGYVGAFRMAGAKWNNFAARSGAAAVNDTETNVKEVLSDGSVISGPVTVKLRAACCYAAAGSYTHASNPGKLLWGYMDDGETDSTGKGAKVEVTGIPYTQYDLYVYCGSDNAGNFGLITVNDTTYPTDATDSKWGEHAKAHETNKWLDLEEGGNYIKVTGLTAETLTFQGAKSGDPSGTRTGIAAFQIVNTGTRRMEVVHKTGVVAVSEVDGKDVILDGDVTLTIDQAIATGFTVTGAAGKTLTIVDGANYQLTAADFAKIKLDGLAGQLVWDTAYVSGKACWMDYEFNGDLTNVGTDTTALNRDSDNSVYLYGEEATSDFAQDADEAYYGLYAGSHPWRNVAAYPSVWTCAIYGTLPAYDNGVLVAFGSTTGGDKGFIGLATASVANNSVKLVYANAAGTIVKEQAMTVPEAFTTPHLYLFTLDGDTITVYLDGKQIAVLRNEGGYTFGTGLQIASVHGGTPSPLLRFAPNVFEDSVDDPRAKSCVIDAMRLYNVRLGQKAIDALKAEFPFESQAGRFTRTLDGTAANWSAADAWATGTATAMVPDADSNVALTATAATEVTINLETPASYATVTVGGSAAVTFKPGTASVVSADTTLDTAVTIKYGALTIGGTLTIGETGSLVFDYSGYPITSVTTPLTLGLTGITANYGNKVTLVTPQEMAGRTMTLVYDTDSQSYKVSISLPREEGDIYIPEGNVTLTNSFAYVDAQGNSTFPFYPNDWLIVNHEQTVTIGENLTVAPKILVVEGGKLKVDFASGVTVGNLTVKVAEGGVYDVNHYTGHKDFSHPIILAGGTLTNGGIAQDVSARQYWQISLEADSYVNVTNTFGAVNNGHAQHNFALNGYKLTKTGTGTYILKTANFVGGGTLEVQEGNVDLSGCVVPSGAALNFVVADGATITVDNVLAKSGTVKGAGTVIYTAGVNTSAIYQDAGWSGTIWIKNMVWDNWNLGRDGNSNTGSKIKLTGLYGYGDADGCGAEIVLQDEGNIKALTVTNSADRTGVYFFNKVSGSGTFTWDTTVTTNVIDGRIYWLKNVSGYTGQLVTSDKLQFSIGGTSSGDLTPGAIKVAADATICAGNWQSKSISFAGDVVVKGARNNVVATVVEQPANLPSRITLQDATGETVAGLYSLKARTVTGGYEVYVAASGFTIHLR